MLSSLALTLRLHSVPCAGRNLVCNVTSAVILNNCPADTVRSNSVGIMLGQRRRRWFNIKVALDIVGGCLIAPSLPTLDHHNSPSDFPSAGMFSFAPEWSHSCWQRAINLINMINNGRFAGCNTIPVRVPQKKNRETTVETQYEIASQSGSVGNKNHLWLVHSHNILSDSVGRPPRDLGYRPPFFSFQLQVGTRLARQTSSKSLFV